MKRYSIIVGLFLISKAGLTAETKLTYHGHAAFQITTPKGTQVFIDPWLRNPLNPASKNGKNPILAIDRADYILITHGHSDHVGDAVELAKKTKAKLVASFELGTNLVRAMGYPKQQVGMDSLGNPGGELSVAGSEIQIAFTPAVHSSGLDPDPSGKHPMIYGGNPVGFIMKIQNGPTIYHSGDTAYFKDMEVIGEMFQIDLALLNLGGHFGMEPSAAVKAANAIKSKMVIPHHFKTFPILVQDTKEFFSALDQSKIAHQEMEPGSSIVFSGTNLKK